ncbi:hypothetical protein BJ138DRAFT_1167358 [Hygrophoropsis aurantiaca]|uniref:Uncharacterized protein n=1 Tax=Hygrophoropsis aurantiaca TaxID=72124 RepID=A0ACB7ZS94_9AGAM|nr:hypothetical protein BJ138DRAFT_1167358 [Hygrophoropsis aurantiaca]
MPLTRHLYCLHHLNGNITKNLRHAISADWANFTRDFWAGYRAVSPEEFDRLWAAIVARYPAADEYLREIYNCRERWAWAWVSHVFTAGVRTNGRVESENRVNKALGGPKKPLLHLFNSLNERTNGQTVQEMIRVRESSRRQHNFHLETLFTGPLALLRKYAGPFALQTCYRQMEESVFYEAHVVQRPLGVSSWTEYAVQASGPEHGYDWSDNEENHMSNSFKNDNAHISTKWLLRLTTSRGLQVQHLLKIVHQGTNATHYLALLPDNRFVCDCCMGMNLGIPCRHYFKAFLKVDGLAFHIGLIRSRWYQDPLLDITTVSSITRDNTAYTRTDKANLRSDPIHPSHLANPLGSSASQLRLTPAPSTQTVNARTAYQEAHAALKPLLIGIQTQDELDDLKESLDELRRQRAEEQGPLGDIRDPPIMRQKGRPRTTRLTGAIEGRQRGGGGQLTSTPATHLSRPSTPVGTQTSTTAPSASRPALSQPRLASQTRPRKCGLCRREGHTRATCDWIH